MGSVFACLLAEAGHFVDVLARGSQLQAIGSRGLVVSGIWGDHASLPRLATDDARKLATSYDAVLLTTKSSASEAVLADLAGHIDHAQVAIALQNGLGNVERLASSFVAELTLAGRVIFGARITEPGCVEVTVEAEPVLLGKPEGGVCPAADEWAQIFASAGISCLANEDIREALWAKVFYNAALNPMGALLACSYGELAADPQLRLAMAEIVGEAFAVAIAEGVQLRWPNAEAYLTHFHERLVPLTARHRSSMLQDLELGRTTEIDAICGEICRRAERAGLAAPANRVLLALVEARTRDANRAPSAPKLKT